MQFQNEYGHCSRGKVLGGGSTSSDDDDDDGDEKDVLLLDDPADGYKDDASDEEVPERKKASTNQLFPPQTIGDEIKELEQIKSECSAMETFLKQRRREESDLSLKCTILAREALLCGFNIELLEAPMPKRRRKSNAAASK